MSSIVLNGRCGCSETQVETLFKALFPAILREDLHHSNDGILESTRHQNMLEPLEDDLLVYTVGNEDDHKPKLGYAPEKLG